MHGSAFGDIITGDAGYNELRGFDGSDYLYGGDGYDDLYGGHDGDFLFGEDQDDYLYGGDGNDFLYGGDGYDTIEGGAGGDYIDGGADDDRVSYRNAPAGVTVDLASGSGSRGHATNDVFVSIENVRGSDYADTIIGNDDDNLLYGESGNDTTGRWRRRRRPLGR